MYPIHYSDYILYRISYREYSIFSTKAKLNIIIFIRVITNIVWNINIRVLHVSPSFPPDKGGIANHVSNLCIYLTKQGNNISIIAPKSIHNKIESKVKGFEHIHRTSSFYLPRWPYPTLRSVSIPIDLGLRMGSFIQKGSFDIIHAHGHHYPISWLAINYAKKYDVPCVLTLHGGMYSLNPYNLGGKTIFEQVFNKYVLSRILAATDAVVGLTKQITRLR